MRFVSLLLMSALFIAPGVRADVLDDAIRAEMKRTNVPGVGVAVVRNGQIVLERGYGLANVEHDVPVTPKTMFQSGSVGKTFTAALIMLLAEEGKLRLDDPISRHLPTAPKAWELITVRHLLSHTSGLGDPYRKLDMRKDYSDEELIALEATIPMLFAPGEKYSYSNMGYHLLGFIANKVGGKFYGDQLRDRIFAPLGMSTRIISESDIVPHRASGYEPARGVLKNQAWVAPQLNTTADGSLYLTARDLALWDIALYDNKILSNAIREASWTPAKLNSGASTQYGYGWQLSPRNGKRSISHGGAWQGFRAQLSRYVDDKLTVVVLANSGTARASKIADIIAGHYIPALAEKIEVAIADTQPEVTARMRAVHASYAAGTAPIGLTDRVAAILTPARLKDLARMIGEWGPVQSVELLSAKLDGEQKRSRYRFVLASEIILYDMSIDKEGRIEMIGLRPQ
jgi:CubicO group peptidase (beta-lactamase class C family)